MQTFENTLTRALSIEKRQYALINSDHSPLIGFPAGNKANAREFRGKCKKLMDNLPPGKYSIVARDAPSQKNPVYFEFETEPEVKTVTEYAAADNSDFYERINQLQKEKVELEFENQRLQFQIAHLEENIEELQKETKELGDSEREKDIFSSIPDWAQPLIERAGSLLIEKLEGGAQNNNSESEPIPELPRKVYQEVCSEYPGAHAKELQEKIFKWYQTGEASEELLEALYFIVNRPLSELGENEAKTYKEVGGDYMREFINSLY